MLSHCQHHWRQKNLNLRNGRRGGDERHGELRGVKTDTSLAQPIGIVLEFWHRAFLCTCATGGHHERCHRPRSYHASCVLLLRGFECGTSSASSRFSVVLGWEWSSLVQVLLMFLCWPLRTETVITCSDKCCCSGLVCSHEFLWRTSCSLGPFL